MAERLRIGVAVLAAGASRRFGPEDKLAQSFRGRPLGEHAVAAIPRGAFERAWVIAPGEGHSCASAWRAAGFAICVNPDRDEGMGTSVALAGELAAAARLDALMLALADMPLVPRAHFEALVARMRSPADILTSARGMTRMPPAIFGSRHFPALTRLGADRGARDLLEQGQVIECPGEWLADIDTPGDLADLQ